MEKVKVWDGFVRFFHWSLILLIGVLYFSGEEGFMDLHFVAGYSLLSLIIARLFWAFIGSDTAKLKALLHSPKAVVNSIKTHSYTRGHNPAGSYMVLTFFSLLLIQSTSGLMTTDDILTDGPLVQYVESSWVEIASSVHKLNFDFLIAAITVHIFAIVVYRIRGKNLVKPMLTGFSSEPYINEVKMRTGWWGFMVLVIIMSLIFYAWGLEPLQAIFS
ncbi:cytochrome [Pseudoalteromonas sp. NBT06-2]|uniref:cytochrome b/b6 domain-containing protein n=1 Tax=Pseudoalteromonas sp. NBT06-2 TaxID=2025950 RepID=UPI000BA6F1F6|nr:cytochrome b/b6 domain-containing protein [Pseudoalteromonas sp. NBT06-2]PAJ73599.1 cytochrome [Pseudoalteromonas sp. NBT06-2]